MKFKHLIVAGVLSLGALLGGLAIAQTTPVPAPGSMGITDRIQVIPNGQPSAQSVYGTLTQLKAWVLGGQSAHSAVPVVTACGTSPVTQTGSSDVAGRVTTGTATPTSCTITFAQPFTGIPACVVVSQTAYATSTPSYTVSATAIVITQAAVNSVPYSYICASVNGG